MREIEEGESVYACVKERDGIERQERGGIEIQETEGERDNRGRDK